jgi:hypothetical protein
MLNRGGLEPRKSPYNMVYMTDSQITSRQILLRPKCPRTVVFTTLIIIILFFEEVTQQYDHITSLHSIF